MWKLFTVLLFSVVSLTIFSQSESDDNTYVKIPIEKYDSLLVAVSSQNEQIGALMERVEEYRWTVDQLAQLKREHDVLRDIMKQYVKQIDSLYSQVQRLDNDLEKCEKERFLSTGDKSSGKMKYGMGGGNENDRIRYNQISTEGIKVKAETKISFAFEVDKDGNVTSAEVLGNATTTRDQQLIQQIRSRCVEQLKYSKKDEPTHEYYSIIILP